MPTIRAKKNPSALDMLVAIEVSSGSANPGEMYWRLRREYDMPSLVKALTSAFGKNRAFKAIVLAGLKAKPYELSALTEAYPVEIVNAFPASRRIWSWANEYDIGRDRIGRGLYNLMMLAQSFDARNHPTFQFMDFTNGKGFVMVTANGRAQDITDLAAVVADLPYKKAKAGRDYVDDTRDARKITTQLKAFVEHFKNPNDDGASVARFVETRRFL